MLDKSDTWFEFVDDDGAVLEAFHWAYCTVEGCANRVCRNVSDKFCHPHSAGRAADRFIAEIVSMEGARA